MNLTEMDDVGGVIVTSLVRPVVPDSRTRFGRHATYRGGVSGG